MSHTASFFVRLRAERGTYSYNRDQITGVKATSLRQFKPGTERDEIAVKVTLTIPDEAFNPYELPEVSLTITPAEIGIEVEEA